MHIRLHRKSIAYIAYTQLDALKELCGEQCYMKLLRIIQNLYAGKKTSDSDVDVAQRVWKYSNKCFHNLMCAPFSPSIQYTDKMSIGTHCAWNVYLALTDPDISKASY